MNHIKRVCENRLCNILMPSEDTNILGFNQNPQFEKESSIILTDLEFLGEKIDGCKNNVENSSTRK